MHLQRRHLHGSHGPLATSPKNRRPPEFPTRPRGAMLAVNTVTWIMADAVATHLQSQGT